MLFQACERYITHNEAQLGTLKSQKHSKAPYVSGFYSWAARKFEWMQGSIFGLDDTRTLRHDVENHNDDLKRYFEKYGFGQLSSDSSNSYCRSIRGSDYFEKGVFVLHDLTTLTGSLSRIIANLNAPPIFRYGICLKTEGVEIIANMLYMEINDGSLQYTVMDPSGQIKTAQLSDGDLGVSLQYELCDTYHYQSRVENYDRYKLNGPAEFLTTAKLEQLHPRILSAISQREGASAFISQFDRWRNDCVGANSREALLGYSLCLKQDGAAIENNKIYVEFIDNAPGKYSIKYTVRDQAGNIKEGQIDELNDMLANRSRDCGDRKLKVPLDRNKKGNIKRLNLILPLILDIISARDHIHPISIQIVTMLNKFRTLTDFVDTLPKYHSHKKLSDLRRHLNDSYPTFEHYLKGLAVKELKATLANPDLSDEASIQAVEQQLANPITRDILTKNRQSQSEHILKILSVVTILIGVGIFPTLGLVFKRLYDSGGTSINFFKPLSKNLCEEAATITSSIENSPQQSQF